MRNRQKVVTFITIIVILTIGIQAYWNYTQYLNNRILVINEIQSILDKVSFDYTKKNTINSILPEGLVETDSNENKTGSMQKIVNNIIQDVRAKKQIDSNVVPEAKISYEIVSSWINLDEFDNLLKEELIRKNYNLDYNLTISENGKVTDSIGKQIGVYKILSAKTQIASLDYATINLNYSNPIIPSLLKGLTGVISSFILCAIVVFSLYYLLDIIKKQKQISEIKNDFISSVTHEFKTPITTVSSAIEAIKNFNNETLNEKSRRYLDISSQQLNKLNLLVEKVMATSLLESSELQLDKEKTDLIKLLKESIEKNKLNTSKNILFESSIEMKEVEIDQFHFENAVSNLIENAIKYGGSEIKISVKFISDRLTISISDNGIGISKEDEPYIFDKFYRTKSENAHNIKGFGIGLYYTKNIIEKHNGTIELKDRNTFLITLWTK